MSDRKKLEKLLIRSFDDRKFQQEDTSKKFVVPINPESFSKNFRISFDTQQAQGSGAAEARYRVTLPEELRLEFVLDGTKTMENYGGENKEYKTRPVKDQLRDFLKCVYMIDGKIHRPRFLIVFWGSEINFRCVLSDLDVNHTLFEPDGSPLRIKVNATFLKHIPREEMVAENLFESPDLTHYRKVTQGDRLDSMTYSIYNDSKYFMQVGLANSLTSIRNVRPGLDLYFPPFKKEL